MKIIQSKKAIMKKIVLFLCIAVLCAACSTSKFSTSDVKPVEITEMLKIEPFSYISFIERGNQGVISDSISRISKAVLNESLGTFSERLRLSPVEIILADSVERHKLEEELRILITTADRNKNVQNIPITPVVSSLLSTSGKRFGLIIVQNGFTRTRSNYGGQVAAQIGIGILTGVLTGRSYYQNPIKANSILYAMIVDNQNKNVAFYNKNVLQDKEPVEKEHIIRQLNKVFEKYFWDK
jgi:hypothetical protein